MKLSIRKIKPDDTRLAERLVMRTMNRLRETHSMPPVPYKPRRARNTMMCHLLRTDPGGTIGAFSGNRMVGYASAMIRDGHWYLAHLFTDQRFQGKGIGRKLLKRVYNFDKKAEIHTRSLATFAFNPFAVQLYAQFGMYPIQMLPMMSWTYDKKKRVQKIKTDYDLKAIPIEDYEQIPILNRFDLPNRGVCRPEDHKFWIDSQFVHGFIFKYRGRPVGYTWITRDSVIAPVAVSKPKYLIPCLAETINYMRGQKFEKLMVWVPGNNGSVLDFLFQTKFKLEENELLMSDRPFANDECYIPASLAFY
jgi:GNAT superfamily N-acetyltransferase